MCVKPMWFSTPAPKQCNRYFNTILYQKSPVQSWQGIVKTMSQSTPGRGEPITIQVDRSSNWYIPNYTLLPAGPYLMHFFWLQVMSHYLLPKSRIQQFRWGSTFHVNQQMGTCSSNQTIWFFWIRLISCKTPVELVAVHVQDRSWCDVCDACVMSVMSALQKNICTAASYVQLSQTGHKPTLQGKEGWWWPPVMSWTMLYIWNLSLILCRFQDNKTMLITCWACGNEEPGQLAMLEYRLPWSGAWGVTD